MGAHLQNPAISVDGRQCHHRVAVVAQCGPTLSRWLSCTCVVSLPISARDARIEVSRCRGIGEICRQSRSRGQAPARRSLCPACSQRRRYGRMHRGNSMMTNQSTEAMLPLQILRLPQVCRITGLCRSMIYQLESQRRFPCRVRIGARAVGWVESEVHVWLARRIRHHRACIHPAARPPDLAE